ncbi:nuclear transport factor 2 family protein [candidate division WOR-3 bacterium]|nr:nuclear transport factor 2 family protein [candidate division WOR-3 bacterium]
MRRNLEQLGRFVLVVWIFLGFIVIILGITQCGRESTREEDMVQIKKFLETAGEAVNQGDVEAEVSRFTEDGIYMWPGAPAIEGQEALREWFERRFAKVEAHIDSRTEEIVVCGDWAFERGTSVVNIRQKDSNHFETVRGKYINILRRQPDGSWKIARRIRNRDHPTGQP